MDMYHRTRTNIQGQRGHLDFCAEICVICIVAFNFSIGPNLGDKYDLILALRSQTFRIFSRNFLQACLKSSCNRLVQKKKNCGPAEAPDHF